VKQPPPNNPGGAVKDAPASTSTTTAAVPTNTEIEAIRQASEDFVLAFNKQDAKGVAACWTQDGDYVDETGQMFSGRAAIEDVYTGFFSEHSGTKMRIAVDAIRLLNDRTAIEDGRAFLEPAPDGPPATSKYTVVHVKEDGKWLMSTVRDVRVETPSSYPRLQGLEWLVGSWSAEEHGAKTDVVCRWVADKSFLQCTYSVMRPDQTTTSGIQLIGWNSQRGQLQSWDFTSGGGHAVGVWTPVENGWTVETIGVLADGTSTRAVNLLTRIDDNAYAWQSTDRMAGQVALADIDEIVLKRHSTDQ
jgi:uncharacterized protein (TIGR02246 family)